MMQGITKIEWTDPGEAMPAFFLMIMMPLSYNLGYGLIAGWAMWVIINVPSILIDLCRKPTETRESIAKYWSDVLASTKRGFPCAKDFEKPELDEDTKDGGASRAANGAAVTAAA